MVLKRGHVQNIHCHRQSSRNQVFIRQGFLRLLFRTFLIDGLAGSHWFNLVELSLRLMASRIHPLCFLLPENILNGRTTLHTSSQSSIYTIRIRQGRSESSEFLVNLIVKNKFNNW
ncbi:uncharacterized protein H6S33_003283 [Morchella sextelata]|uniref:uncharacterized protein n=1 Tax=Morchella sextelata TaxID=1174677 RepID=UPI001D059B0C|nr:uncharacterized protein H6S33_003283 [Morchella sextelata]KAH0607295.1 hypothetical protein H6S33_003283 [Morchella sextelata]